MRFIDIEKLKELAQNDSSLASWTDIERTHIEILKPKNKTERSEYLKSNTDWNKWIDKLKEISHGKCWYTEAPSNSTFWAVEHFRPKNRAKYGEGKNDILVEGYWWLAYDIENFRLAGSVVNLRRGEENSGEILGKGNYFPLYLKQCKPCEPHQNHKQEMPLLLDPTNFKDITLISFDAGGSMIPASPKNEYEKLKIETSETFLALNHPQIKDGRQKTWKACLDLIGKAEKYRGYENNPQNEQELNKIYYDIKQMAQPSSVYTAVVKACLKFHYKLYPDRFDFLEEILESL